MNNIPSTLTSDDDVTEILRNEYCEPTGCTDTDFLRALVVPPLNTVVRYNYVDNKLIDTAEQKRAIHAALWEANRERLGIGQTLLVEQVLGLADTWTCHVSNDGDLNKLDWETCPMDRRVIVDLAAGEALLRGANLYAQGVLGCSINMQVGQRVWIFCDIEGKCRKGRTEEFTDEIYFVGAGIAKVSRADLFCPSPATGIAVCIDQPRYNLLSLNELSLSLPVVTPQNLPSCVAVQVLDPQTGDTILDCCAAPGGKTLHIASILRGSGRIVALDKSVGRARKLKEATQHLRNVAVYHADVCHIDTTTVDTPPLFDRILVDAPCSASGQKPRLSLRSLRVGQLGACPTGQKRILRAVIPFLKVGGSLVYSTCSILRRENEDIIGWVLQEFPQMILCAQNPHIGERGFLVDGLSKNQSDLLQRFSVLPKSGLDTIGFFVALLKKIW